MSENKNRDYVIHIDRVKYTVETRTLTGSALRALPELDISGEYELMQEVPGGEDLPVGDDHVVELKNGMHFFSAPRNITPGR